MARMSIGQKAARVLEFMLGLRNARVAATLSAHGFKDEDLREGWSLMQALTSGRLDVALPITVDPSVLVALDTWENKWFPIANASLRARFPEVHAEVFRNLSQATGAEVIITVGTFLDRINTLKSTAIGKSALELLAKRGIGEATIAEAKALLKKIETVDTVAKDAVSPEEEARREAALWSWYREWSEISRTVITDRRQLRALGFLDDSGRASPDPTEEGDDSPVVVVPTVVNTGKATAVPATPIAPMADKPRIDPGMPGADPFVDGN